MKVFMKSIAASLSGVMALVVTAGPVRAADTPAILAAVQSQAAQTTDSVGQPIPLTEEEMASVLGSNIYIRAGLAGISILIGITNWWNNKEKANAFNHTQHGHNGWIHYVGPFARYHHHVH